MSKFTAEQIGQAAELACFYVTPTGQWLRMDYCDMEGGKFQASDEDSGEEYVFAFDEFEDEAVHFEMLTRITIGA